jgi:hypothetical protein
MKLILLLTLMAVISASVMTLAPSARSGIMTPAPSAKSNVMTSALNVPSHCAPQEKVIFSCATTNAKIISLCSSSTLTASEGYLQYRFGPAGKPELVYPATKEHPSKHFLFGHPHYTGAFGDYLKFKNGEYAYALFDFFIKFEGDKTGVVVSKSEEQIAYIPCKGGSQLAMGINDFEKIKIPRDPDEGGFVIPE